MSFFKDRTAGALEDIRKITHDDLRGVAETMVEVAKANSPVDTGHNRDSIDFKETLIDFRVFTESGYGAYLELGTARMAAMPYFAPAFEQAKREFGQ